MRRAFWGTGFCATLLMAGCPTDQRNAFLTLTETLGATSSGSDGSNGGSNNGGSQSETTFRDSMTITLENTNPNAELNVAVAAWVNTSSIRSAAQQDALINGGYVQLTREEKIGTVYTLPPGTFVLNGPGNAGSKLHVLNRGTVAGQTVTPSQETITLITPDVVLLYLAPPTSCESPAYAFTVEGFPVDAEITNAEGASAAIEAYSASNHLLGVKSLAQMSNYQCSPLRPGMFRKVGGGTRADNEFFDGENIRATFNILPNDNGDTAEIVFEE